jgi:hypothetical protein
MRTPLLTILAVASIGLLFAGCAGPRGGSGSGTGAPFDAEQYTGTLKSGFMAIGGEHTGWMLQREDQDDLEVDVNAVRARAREFDGQRVTITGTIETKSYVERGPTPILVARSIDAAG